MSRLHLRFVRPRQLSSSHRLGVLGGSVLVAVGVLGLAFNWGASTTTTTRAGTETPQEFLRAFTTAVRDGDGAFLFARMDPAVLARYGTAQCQSAAAQLADPSIELRLVSVHGPAPFAYATSGRSVTVANTYTLRVAGTEHRRAVNRDVHLALVDGRFRIFAECGQALPGAP